MERELAQLSFAMDDLRLFLDTHPCDKAALAAHEEVRDVYKRQGSNCITASAATNTTACWASTALPVHGLSLIHI